MTAKFYVLVNPEAGDDFFILTDDEHKGPRAFDTEEDAIAEAKDYSSHSLVLRSTASVTEISRYKVERLK